VRGAIGASANTIPDSGSKTPIAGLGLVPNACVLPHHNTFGKIWAARVAKQLPEVVLLGIDERTGMIDDGDKRRGLPGVSMERAR